MTRVLAADVDALLLGLCLLGSGGGGDPGLLARSLRYELGGEGGGEGGEGGIALHAAADLGEAPVVAVGMLGATRMLAEKLPGGTEFRRAVQALTRWTGQAPLAVMPYEAAGLNGALALVAARQLDLPLVDADLMGRAMPRLDQLSRAVDGGPLTPYALAEPAGQTVLVDGADPVALERVARAFVAQCGGWAGTALVPVPASVVVRDSCQGSLTRALALGRAHAALPRTPSAAQVAAALGGRVLAAGRTVEIVRQESTVFGRASIAVVDDDGPVLRLEAENEYLLALRDGEPVAGCPDLLCVLNRRTAAPIPVDGLRLHDDVTVVVLPGPRWWWDDPRRLAAVGPRAFGLDCDPVRSDPAPADPAPAPRRSGAPGRSR